VLAIRYLSGEVSVGGGADGFPENGRYMVDSIGARFIYTRKSTPSEVLLQPSIQVLMKKESRHRLYSPTSGAQGDDVPAKLQQSGKFMAKQ
jgi:hypothetical protein